MRVEQQTTQNEQKIHGAAMRICLFCSGGTFFAESINKFTKPDGFSKSITKSMQAIVICIASRGHKT